MRSCPSCGSQSPDHARFCGKCGQPFGIPSSLPIEASETVIIKQRSSLSHKQVVQAERDWASVLQDIQTEVEEPALPSSNVSLLTGNDDLASSARKSEELPLLVEELPSENGAHPPATVAEEDSNDVTIALAEQRERITQYLLAMIPFVDEARSEKNRTQFEKNLAELPPIEDESWGHIAFITGIYGRYMWKHPLNDEQKSGMWQALLWAVRYEQHFRPKMVNDRSGELLNFFNGSVRDSAFQAYAIDDILTLIAELHIATIKKIGERLAKLTQVSPAIVQKFQTKVDERLSASPPIAIQQPHPPGLNAATIELDTVIDAIDQLWPLLDRKTESRNYALFQQAHQALQTSQAVQNLATLATFIVRNALYRYTHESNLLGSTLSDQQLSQVLTLAHFAAQQTNDEATRYAHFLFHALQRMRNHSLDAAAFTSEFRSRFVGTHPHKAAGELWSDLIGLLTCHLSEQRKAGTIDSIEAEAWIQVFADIGNIHSSDSERFLTEVRKHRVRDSIALKKLQNNTAQQQASTPSSQPLAFLGEERRKDFLESIRAPHLDKITSILQEARQPLLATLSRLLADPSFHEVLPPRRPLHIRNKQGKDLFPEAKAYIQSTNQEDWRKALPIFEQGERDTPRRDFKTLAREWSYFAQALVHGPVRVVARWEDNRKKGLASWEEIWNLAVFYLKINQVAQALDVLSPGVINQAAPFAHVCFALYCGVQIIEHSDQEKPEVVYETETFLIQHLTKLPIPECYLAWLLLINEHKEDVDLLKRLRMLSTFQELLEHPAGLLPTEELHVDNTVDTFQRTLQHLSMEATWQIWINDYAERHPYNRKAWQLLSETNEQNNNLEQAEKALQHIARIQLDQHQRQINKGVTPPDLRYLRTSLIKIFEFYRRHDLMTNSNATFQTYYKALPELWDSQVPGNKLLIDLTRIHTEGGNASPKQSKLPGDVVNAWLNLQSALGNTHDLDSLKELQTRLDVAIDLLTTHQKAAREGASFIKNLLHAVCDLNTVSRQHNELHQEVKRLNNALQQAYHIIQKEPALTTLKALVAATQRAFEKFSANQQLAPRMHVHPTPLGYGLPVDLTETALIVRLTNPGPGDVSNIQITCSNAGHIISRKEGKLATLPEQCEGVVAIPVTTHPTREGEQIECQVHVQYQWGVMHGLKSSHPITTHWFSFHDFLQQRHITDYEIPIPYVFDTAIDFNKHDPRLFQGRENEINLVRNVFLKGQMSGAPIYFHGIRKVGKTSLLHRICLELQQENFLPFVVDLHGIKASQQTLDIVINTFTTRILENIASQGFDISGIQPVAVEHKNPVVGVEHFFKALRERAGTKQMVLLLDEFHVIVAERTTTLLDLLRRIHQNDHILFIMSGWLRPEPMRRACPETQLFPLLGRPVDYLSLDTVRQVLRVPVSDYGITIPEDTIRQVYIQTAGNPYHVAKLASFGIAQLNAEHRTALAPQDIDEIADMLSKDPANFTSSSFSPLIFTPEEQSVAIRFSKELQGQRDSLLVEEASHLFGLDIIRSLEEKYVLELCGERLYVRSKMLTTYLQTRMVEPITPPVQTISRKRVGMFIDYENLLPLLPIGMKTQDVGTALTNYASQFGEIVCRWVCADPRNMPDAVGTRLVLEQAGFLVQYPRGEPQSGPVAKNLTDFALLERINDETTHSEPDIYLIVSGDRDYYEKITGLLDHGYVVRLAASTSQGHLASKYKRLQEQRTQIRHAEGYTESDFFIDDLDVILSSTIDMPQ